MRAGTGAIRGGVAAALPLLMILPGPTPAQEGGAGEIGPTEKLDRAVSGRMGMNEEALVSQQRIEALSDETEDLLTRYRGALRQIESLRAYNSQMEALIVSQEEEVESIQQPPRLRKVRGSRRGRN